MPDDVGSRDFVDSYKQPCESPTHEAGFRERRSKRGVLAVNPEETGLKRGERTATTTSIHYIV